MQSACTVLYISNFGICGFFQIFTHYLINGTNFEKNVTGHMMCVLILSTTLSQIFLILRNNQRDVIVNVHLFARKVPVILVRN